MSIEGLEETLVGLIKRAMQGDERHQYTYSIMLRNKPEAAKEIAKEAKRQLEEVGKNISWCPDLT